MKDKNCSRCGDSLSDPIETNANYIRSDEFIVDEEVEVYRAYKHTQETVQLVREVAEKTGRDFQALAGEMAHQSAEAKLSVSVGTEMKKEPNGTEVNTAVEEEIDFSIPLEKFKEIEVDTPEAIKQDDVALVETVMEPRPIQKMALVCPDCTVAEDEVIWGPNK